MKLNLVTAPTGYPVSRAEAKTHLRIPTSETGDDNYVDALITAATEVCEQITNRKLVTQTWDLFMNKFPYCREFEVPYPKLQSVGSITYFDVDNNAQTLNPSNYQVDNKGIVGIVRLNKDYDWPDTREDKLNAVTMRFTCGYGTATEVPKSIKQAILLMIGTWYENRESVVQGFVAMKVPDTIELLLASNRVYSFA